MASDGEWPVSWGPPAQKPTGVFPASSEAHHMEAYDRLVKLVNDVADEVSKAEGGNKAAGTRVRKAMQEVKKAAQEVRVGMLQSRGEDGD